VVELHEDSPEPAEAELIEHVKGRLASYKAPRRVRTVSTIGRAPNGKVDYKRHRAESMDELGGVAAG
jgi:acyl-CoA synthetase (AMP-forming)/AMP-acid ligase II